MGFRSGKKVPVAGLPAPAVHRNLCRSAALASVAQPRSHTVDRQRDAAPHALVPMAFPVAVEEPDLHVAGAGRGRGSGCDRAAEERLASSSACWPVMVSRARRVSACSSRCAGRSPAQGAVLHQIGVAVGGMAMSLWRAPCPCWRAGGEERPLLRYRREARQCWPRRASRCVGLHRRAEAVPARQHQPALGPAEHPRTAKPGWR